LLVGAILLPCGLFQWFDDENTTKKLHWYVSFVLLEQILAQWQHPVASRKAMNPLHWLMHTKSYRCTATAIGMTNKVGLVFILVVLPATLPAAGVIRSK
jgi:hypothetical protein